MTFNLKIMALAVCTGIFALHASAQTVDLPQALAMSLSADPRIQEKNMLVEQARAMLAEAQGSYGLRLDSNLFVGLAPGVSGGFYQDGANSGTIPRDDAYHPRGLSDWTVLQFAIIKPLYTFGKIEKYAEAAEGNIEVKRQDSRLQRGSTMLDVNRAYYGFLAARDTRRMLEDVFRKVDDSIARVERLLREDSAQVKQSDLYELQSKSAVLKRYLAQASAVEIISLNGLKVLTGVGINADLSVADEALMATPMPTLSLNDYQGKAVSLRPEFAQLEAGLRARRALVDAKKAEAYPDIYAGLVGSFAYSSRRDSLDNPYVQDPFNHAGLTPVLGMKWNVAFDVVPARTAQAQAELDALLAKNRFAMLGIPYEVAEAYANVQATWTAQNELATGAAAARRWMVASFADFTAGLESVARVAEALKSYATIQADYLMTLNEYNLNVAKLTRVAGDYK
jgi:outer membrane protein